MEMSSIFSLGIGVVMKAPLLEEFFLEQKEYYS
jgi:hypothetical protein